MKSALLFFVGLGYGLLAFVFFALMLADFGLQPQFGIGIGKLVPALSAPFFAYVFVRCMMALRKDATLRPRRGFEVLPPPKDDAR